MFRRPARVLVAVTLAISIATPAAAAARQTAPEPGPTDTVSFIAAQPAGLFTESSGRLADTRVGGQLVDGPSVGRGQLASGEVLIVSLVERGQLEDPTGSVLVNLTAVQPQGPGFLTAYDCGNEQPDTSNLNVVARETRSNLALVNATGGQLLCVVSSVETHVLVDLVGFFDDDRAEPTRAVDSRQGLGATRLEPGIETPIRLGPGVTPGVVLSNVTAVGADTQGWLALGPCGDLETSLLNFDAGRAVANMTMTGETPCALASTRVDLIIDVVSSISPPDLFPVPLPRIPWTPVARRAADSRTMDDVDPLAVGERRFVPNGSFELSNAVDRPQGTFAALVNLTTINPVADGFATVETCLEPPSTGDPGTSSSNVGAGVITAHSAVVPAMGIDLTCVYSSVASEFIVDTIGRFDLRHPPSLVETARCVALPPTPLDGSRFDFGEYELRRSASDTPLPLDGTAHIGLRGVSGPTTVDAQVPDGWTVTVESPQPDRITLSVAQTGPPPATFAATSVVATLTVTEPSTRVSVVDVEFRNDRLPTTC